MSDKITAKVTHYLKGRQNVFAVFDPFFMVGDRGIIEQLKKNPDLKVTQVERLGFEK